VPVVRAYLFLLVLATFFYAEICHNPRNYLSILIDKEACNPKRRLTILIEKEACSMCSV
jgi:thioredoxin-related protein